MIDLLIIASAVPTPTSVPPLLNSFLHSKPFLASLIISSVSRPGIVVPIPIIPSFVTIKVLDSTSPPTPVVLGPPTWNLPKGSVFATPTLPPSGPAPVLIPVNTVPPAPTSNLWKTVKYSVFKLALISTSP